MKTYDVRIAISRGTSYRGDLVAVCTTLDEAKAEVARLYRIGAATLCTVYERYTDEDGAHQQRKVAV